MSDGDWRLRGQEDYLQAATLQWKRYRARRPDWEHEHCEFCWAKFMDPDFSEEHRRFIDEHPDVLTAGYTTTTAHPHGAECHWVCKRCFDDFTEAFAWRVASGD